MFYKSMISCFAYLIGHVVHLFQIQIYCSEANCTTDITLHSQKLLFFVFCYISTLETENWSCNEIRTSYHALIFSTVCFLWS